MIADEKLKDQFAKAMNDLFNHFWEDICDHLYVPE